MNNILLPLLLLATSPIGATSLSNPNALVDMMRSMLNMMETLQFYQKFSGNDGNLPMQPQWARQAPYMNQNWIPAQSYNTANFPSKTFNVPRIQDIEGQWKNNTNVVLNVKQHYGRMYWSANNYRNYYLEVLPPRLKFIDAESGQVQEFDLELEGDRLILKDSSGRTTSVQRTPEQSRFTP